MALTDLVLAAATPLYLAAAYCDVATRLIPDRLSVALLILGVAAATVGDAVPLGPSLGAGIVVFVALALLGGAVIGGGDVKLAAASAVLLGAGRTLDFLLLTALAGGGLALVYLAGRGVLRRRPPPPFRPAGRHGLRRRLSVILAAERRRIRRGSGLPYGVAIAAAALVTLAQTS